MLGERAENENAEKVKKTTISITSRTRLFRQEYGLENMHSLFINRRITEFIFGHAMLISNGPDESKVGLIGLVDAKWAGTIEVKHRKLDFLQHFCHFNPVLVITWFNLLRKLQVFKIAKDLLFSNQSVVVVFCLVDDVTIRPCRTHPIIGRTNRFCSFNYAKWVVTLRNLAVDDQMIIIISRYYYRVLQCCVINLLNYAYCPRISGKRNKDTRVSIATFIALSLLPAESPG